MPSKLTNLPPAIQDALSEIMDAIAEEHSRMYQRISTLESKLARWERLWDREVTAEIENRLSVGNKLQSQGWAGDCANTLQASRFQKAQRELMEEKDGPETAQIRCRRVAFRRRSASSWKKS